jgi:hypothetical protein
MRLTDLQPGSIVHAEMLDGRESAAGRAAAADPDVAHVTDIENPDARAHCFVFRNQAAGRGVLDGHIPAAEIDHFCAQTAVHGV